MELELLPEHELDENVVDFNADPVFYQNAEGEIEWDNGDDFLAAVNPQLTAVSRVPSPPSEGISDFVFSAMDFNIVEMYLPAELHPPMVPHPLDSLSANYFPAFASPVIQEEDQSRSIAQGRFRSYMSPTLEGTLDNSATLSNTQLRSPRVVRPKKSTVNPPNDFKDPHIQPYQQKIATSWSRKDLSRYYGFKNLQSHPRFTMTLVAKPADHYISNNQDLRSCIGAHLLGDCDPFPTWPIPADDEIYSEALALSPTKLQQRKRRLESISSDGQDTPRPNKRREIEPAGKSTQIESVIPALDTQDSALKPHRIHSSGGRIAVTNPKTGGLSSRTAKIDNFKPSEHYQSPMSRPPSWEANGTHFSYNRWAELERRAFTKEEIETLLYQGPARLLGKLTVWIQCVPADSTRRYPTGQSDKCRFHECLVAPKRTISKGFHRVAFDENSGETGRTVDPYHAAGYVHLYCLERFMDFPKLCRELNVKPDTRHFHNEKNRMSIVRDHPKFEVAVKDFIQIAATAQPRQKWDYEKTLESKLTEMHLSLQRFAKWRARLQSQNHIGLHRNDLELFVKGEEEKRLRRKRKREDSVDSEEPTVKRVRP